MPHEARLLIYLGFVPSLAIGFIYTDLSYFLTKVQGLTDFWMGTTIMVMGITLVAASIPLGILADRYGRRKMLILGNLCASLSLIGFALTTNLALVMVVAVLEGIGEAAFAVSGSALLADKAGDEKRTAAYSLSGFLSWIAGALGAFAISSVLLLQTFGLSNELAHVALYVAIGLLNLSVTPAVFLIHETPPKARGEKGKGLLPRRSGRVLVKFGVYSVMIAVGAGLFVPLMAKWFYYAYGATDAISGPVLGASSLLTSVAVLMAPRLAAKFGLVRAIVLSQGLSTFFMVLVPSSPGFGVASLVYTVRVFLMNLSNPLGQSMVMGLVAPDERGAASGINASLWRLPNSLSTAVGAGMMGAGMLALPFYIATVLYVAAISVYWFLFRGAKLPEEVRAPGGQ
ncbi:MAG: MFS transporter [Nitrososphaerales archaeon]|nr:MFS transporter [Nitrososphaerales archaeon]